MAVLGCCHVLGMVSLVQTPIHAYNQGSQLQTFISKDDSLVFTSAVYI